MAVLLRSHDVKMAALLVAAIALAGGCAGMNEGDSGDPEVKSQVNAIVGGTVTSARPEIGTFSRGCTATLIAPRYVLTAGHCTGYSTAVQAGDSVRFTDASGVSHTYSVNRIHTFGAMGGSGASPAFELTPDSFGAGEGTNDVEVLRLATAVPSTVAVPARIASRPPRAGERVTVFGYGCTDRSTKTGGGTKEYFSYDFGTTTQALCPGDSGGPVVFGNVADGGQIWGTNTGYYGSGADVHGDVTYFKNQIIKLMQTWDFAEFEVEIDRAGSDIDHFIQASADPNVCRDACYANENCRAFTYVNPGVQGPQAHCWLKGSIPDFSSNPNCTSGTNLTREVNIDRPGMDYSSFALVEPRSELCLAACARDENCKAYTYVVPGVQGTQARCWLKNGIPARSSNGNATAGVRRGMEYNVDRGGWDYSHFTLGSANPILCQTACANDARCKAFTYVAPGVQGASAGCWLKTDADAPRSMSNVISAMKRGLEVNTDRAGSDYRNFVPSSNVPEVCQAECAKDAACVAWTFVPSHVQGDGARCWLKNSIPAASSQEGIVSGLKGAEFF